MDFQIFTLYIEATDWQLYGSEFNNYEFLQNI